MDNIEDAIVSSIEDAEATPETEVSSEGVESPESTEVAPEAPEGQEGASESVEVGSPATRQEKPADEFEKRFGVKQTADSGRENRIPHSRVVKIVAKAVSDKTAELEKTYTPKIQEFETKVRDYEGRLQQVAEFEQVMANDPNRFLTMLAQIPAYKQIFTDMLKGQNDGQVPTAEPDAAMPAPNQKLSDGSMVYDEAGLSALMKWQADQIEKRVTSKYETRLGEVQRQYEPIRSDWEAQQHLAKIVPQVNAQIADARTWPLFTENEAEIVAALQANQRLSLEGAYQKVVFPKFTADRAKMREEILREVQKAPSSTSAPSRSSKPNAPRQGPQSLEDIIKQSIQSLK